MVLSVFIGIILMRAFGASHVDQDATALSFGHDTTSDFGFFFMQSFDRSGPFGPTGSGIRTYKYTVL